MNGIIVKWTEKLGVRNGQATGLDRVGLTLDWEIFKLVILLEHGRVLLLLSRLL